jgi:small subunit ribosomal protein S3
MGQKIHPNGFRVGVIKIGNPAGTATQGFRRHARRDFKLREFLLKLLAPAGVPKIEIERDAKRVRINIFCAKPGMIIGRGGSEIEKLKALCERKLGGKSVAEHHRNQAAGP